MHEVELKLAHWRALYSELTEARQRLLVAKSRRPAGNEETAKLEERVRQLQEECNAALDAVHALLAARKPPAGSPPPEDPPDCGGCTAQ
jgi:DNA repair exonuclease SbcCD ATPase subunit